MNRRILRLALPSLSVALVVIAAAACDDDPAAPCNQDVQCAPGLVCHQSICVPMAGDADAPEAAGFDASFACSGDGIVCTSPTECCSGQCTANRCGLVPGGGGTACRNQSEPCLINEECCVPFQCRTGLCR